MFIENTAIEEMNDENIELRNNNYEEAKEKSFKTNDKVKKIKNKHKKEEEHATKDIIKRENEIG